MPLTALYTDRPTKTPAQTALTPSTTTSPFDVCSQHGGVGSAGGGGGGGEGVSDVVSRVACVSCGACTWCVNVLCVAATATVDVCIFAIIFRSLTQRRHLLDTHILLSIVWAREGRRRRRKRLRFLGWLQKCYCMKWVNCVGCFCAHVFMWVRKEHLRNLCVQLCFKCGGNIKMRAQKKKGTKVRSAQIPCEIRADFVSVVACVIFYVVYLWHR